MYGCFCYRIINGIIVTRHLGLDSDDILDVVGDTGWIDFTLLNSWQVGGEETPQYRKIGSIVYLRGSFTKNTATSFEVAATLPVGFRPPKTIRFPVTSNSTTYLTGSLNTDGEILFWSSNTTSAFRGIGSAGGFSVD